MISAEQRERRRQGIGGSDAAKIVLGADDFGTALDVYASKVLPLAPDDENPTTRAGNILEPAIRALAAAQLGMAILEAPETYTHPKHGFMLAHLDGLAADGGNVELKALDWRKALRLGEPGTDLCLRPHFIQAQHQMEVTGLPWSYVTYFCGTFDLRIFVVERDREIGAMIAEREGKFWNDHVLARVPPPGDVASQLAFNAARWTKADGEALYAAPESSAEEALVELREAKAAVKAARALEDVAKARVQALMADSPLLECDFGRVSWKPSKSVAWAAVARELRAPKDLIAKHTTTGRTMRSSFDGNDDE